MKPEKKILSFPEKEEGIPSSPPQRKKAAGSAGFLTWYTLALFSLATVLVLLSYGLQMSGERERADALGQAAQERQVAATALERMEQIQQDYEQLRLSMDELEARYEALQEENELLQSSLASQTSRREEENAVYETRLAELRDEAARLRDELLRIQSEMEETP